MSDPAGERRFAPANTPFAAEHARLTRHAVRRNPGLSDRTDSPDVITGAWRPAAIRLARENWRTRMFHEHESSAVFAGLLSFFIEAGLPLELKTAVTRMALDELFHAELCARVVEALGGVALEPVDVRLTPLPRHDEVAATERVVRNVLFACCMSETVSMALLTAERERCEEPFIAEVLKQLVADEVSHAKIGWTVVGVVWPSLDAAARDRTRAYVPVALAHLDQCMLTAMPVSRVPAPVLEHAERLGYSDSTKARALYRATVDDVILPRLRELGLAPEC